MKESKVKIDWLNWRGYREVRQSQMVMDALLVEAEKVGDIETSYVGIDRCHVIVKENDNADRTDR